MWGKAMSLRDHVICDSDLHVMEPPDLWERYEKAWNGKHPGATLEVRDVVVR